MLKELKKEEFDGIRTQEGLVVVDFWAPWCGPCRTLLPILEKVSEEVSHIPMYKANVDEERDLALELGVRNLPTLIFFKNGEIVNRVSGIQSKEKMIQMIQENS